jgi:hypothetical protein
MLRFCKCLAMAAPDGKVVCVPVVRVWILGIQLQSASELGLRTGPMSGRTMARIGLRMMPPFPSSPLRFRTVSFPQSGSKAGISDGAFPSSARNFETCGLHPSFVHLAALTSYPRSKSRDAVR